VDTDHVVDYSDVISCRTLELEIEIACNEEAGLLPTFSSTFRNNRSSAARFVAAPLSTDHMMGIEAMNERLKRVRVSASALDATLVSTRFVFIFLSCPLHSILNMSHCKLFFPLFISSQSDTLDDRLSSTANDRYFPYVFISSSHVLQLILVRL